MTFLRSNSNAPRSGKCERESGEHDEVSVKLDANLSANAERCAPKMRTVSQSRSASRCRLPTEIPMRYCSRPLARTATRA